MVFEEPCRGFFVSNEICHRNYFKMLGMERENTQNENCFSYKEWQNFFINNGFKDVQLINSFTLKYQESLLGLRNKNAKTWLKKFFKLKIINKTAIFLIKIMGPLLNFYMFLFGYPVGFAHEFTRHRGGFEYFTILIYTRK